jgi:hypothetical protein
MSDRDKNTDVMIVWDDGYGPVVAVSSPPLPGWLVTGSEDVFASIEAIIERFPTAASARPLLDRTPVAPTPEAVAQAIHDGPNAQAQYVKAGVALHTWAACPYQEQYLADADAVLGPLGNQPPRADTMTDPTGAANHE